MINVKEDLIGKTFGRLTVIGRADDIIYPSGQKQSRWICKCSCPLEKEVIKTYSNLKNGHATSCGCLKREKVSRAQKEYNKYDLSGEYGIGWTHNTGEEFYFDLEDYDKIKNYCWRAEESNRDVRYLRAMSPETHKNVRMHQIITEYNICDHINRNTFDNRKENLRDVTQQQNSFNRSQLKNNTSGIMGVYWIKDRCLWRAGIKKDDKHIWLGDFINKEDAIVARLNAELKYFGLEFAPQRDLFEKYNILKGEE